MILTSDEDTRGSKKGHRLFPLTVKAFSNRSARPINWMNPFLDMEPKTDQASSLSLQMDTKEQYKKQEAYYHNSAEYIKMINSYQVLKKSIADCSDEEFIS